MYGSLRDIKEDCGTLVHHLAFGGIARELAASLFRNACDTNTVLAQEAKVDMLA